ncbi:MAG: hypothetical protein ABIG30_01140 [Candidatus Aenigmatarchaeota archaeon]
MALIYETKNFIVEAVEKPHNDRNDGGHVKITPKVRVADRQQLSPKLAIELIRLTIVVGQAMTTVMNKRGVDIGRVNYQDNGNWSVFKPEGPYLHYHLYGRAKSAKYNKYGEAIYAKSREENPKHYAKLKPLNKGDVSAIREEIVRLFGGKKFSDSEWGISRLK